LNQPNFIGSGVRKRFEQAVFYEFLIASKH